jgi:ureidoglycolate hydrolase
LDFNLMEAVRTTAMAGFFVAMAGAFWLICKVLDERRGKQLSILQVFLNPLFVPREALTERGQVWHARLVKVWSVGFACWVVVVVTGVFGW